VTAGGASLYFSYDGTKYEGNYMSKREEEETVKEEVAHERPTPTTPFLDPFLLTLPDPETPLARSSNQHPDDAILILDGGLESFVL